MKTLILLAAIALQAAVLQGEVVYLDHQHMDLRLEYDPAAEDTNRLNVVLGYDAGIGHFIATNQQVYIVGNGEAKLAIPDNANYAFLGAPGASIWILPQSQNVALPYLGASAEDIPLDVFVGPLNLELRAVEGPGNFFA